jgi:hypothetical protein
MSHQPDLFSKWIQELRGRLMDQGYQIMEPKQAASASDEKSTPTYARTDAIPTESHPL